MIAIYVPLDPAEALLERSADLADVVKQIRAQLPLERLLPTDARPVMAIWYPDAAYGEEIYDAALAHALWRAHAEVRRVDARVTSGHVSTRAARLPTRVRTR